MDSNVEEESYVDVPLDDLNEHPCCPHGPTLLFSRQTKIGIRNFYACSACRNRKLCRFFLWADEKYSQERKIMWELEQKKFVGEKSHDEIHATFCEVKHAASRKEVDYCHSCNELFLHDNVKKHKNHDVTLNISHHQLLHPTLLLKPLDCDKREAQYLFSEASIKTLINIIFKNKIKSLICISAPRIHEHMKSSHMNIRSILLDLDRRFHTFYGPNDFCWFNSFNYHFFFGQTSKQTFTKFLQHDEKERVLLIVDPPFGGRLEPLAHTINKIESLHKEMNPHTKRKLLVILINPYFMERHVNTCFPTFNMIDYKVTYDNHPLFSQGLKGRKLGSPVRIFTNINPKNVILPEEEYRFCAICDRWVSLENKHCKKCNKCTSKNGSTYWHCAKCQKCVKPSWKHCNKCKRCCLENHECSSARVVKCCSCGEEGHKVDTCINLRDTGGLPVVNLSGKGRKRKGDANQRKFKKKVAWNKQDE